jgi:hypothetical protein
MEHRSFSVCFPSRFSDLDPVPLPHPRPGPRGWAVTNCLAARRTSVTVVAGTLQQAGFIRYRRGHIRLIDVEGLRESACECYETIKLQGKRLLGTPVEESVG